MSYKLTDYRGPRPTWCPGCGHFAVLGCLQQAAHQLGLPRNQLLWYRESGVREKSASTLTAMGSIRSMDAPYR